MQTPILVTDRTALERNRAKAKAEVLFLHYEAVHEVQERLQAVNRQFTSPAIVTPFPKIWQNILPDAKIVADDEVLDLGPGAHDLVIHAMALHWANDPVGQLVQCRRALRPDGLFLGLMLGGQTLAELRVALAEAETTVTGGLSPRVLPMAEIRDLGGLLQRAGFALPVADGFAHQVSYRDALHLMQDLRAMGESNALADRLRRPTARAIMAEAAARYKTHFALPEGRVKATFEMICLTGWAAHESQQKPLRPGSAVQRLEDALRAPQQTVVDPARD